ncbi:MAG: polysaccharide biosynthesis C-terminal domain-containing protein, partial [Oscillospiraceae bacterium]
SISFPLAINSYLNSGLRLIENLIIPFSLRKFGQTFSQSLSTYGMLKGMVMPILIFPSAFLSSLANILVPAIASAKINNDLVKLNKTISKILQLTLLIGILLVGIFMSFSYDISIILYHNTECGKMLFSLSFICPFLYFDMIIVAILNGLSEQITCLKVNLIEALIRIVIIFFIIPIIGINGFLFAIGLSSIFSAILYLRKLISITNVKFDFVNYILKPILSASVVLLSTRFLYKTLTITTIYPSIGLIIGIVISCVIYLILIILLGCIDKKDFIFLLYTIKKKK